MASVAAYACLESMEFARWMQHLIAAVSFIPARRWALYAAFNDIASAYYFLVWPTLPLSAAWIVLRFGFPFRGRIKTNWSVRDRIIGVFYAMALIGFACLLLYFQHGGDSWSQHVGSDFFQLLAYGWAPFVSAGAMLGVAILYILKACSPFPSAIGSIREASGKDELG